MEVLHVHLRDKPTDDIEYVKVAKLMEKFSGADIKAVCDQGAELALRDALRTGRMRPVRTDDLVAATKKVKPSTLEWLSTARNYAMYSNQSGVYDDILAYLKR